MVEGCRQKIVVVDEVKLPDRVELLADLRGDLSDRLVPVSEGNGLVLTGSVEGRQYFLPAQGRLVVAVSLPVDADGRLQVVDASTQRVVGLVTGRPAVDCRPS